MVYFEELSTQNNFPFYLHIHEIICKQEIIIISQTSHLSRLLFLKPFLWWKVNFFSQYISDLYFYEMEEK